MRKPNFLWVLKFNPYHDDRGLFASASGTARPTFGTLLAQIAKPDGGFTVHPTTGQQPTTGFAVSIRDGRILPLKDLTPLDLVKHIQEHQDLLSQEGNYVGAWHNPEDGNVHLDVSKVVTTQAEAERIGHDHHQIAIFDFNEKRVIYLKKAA